MNVYLSEFDAARDIKTDFEYKEVTGTVLTIVKERDWNLFRSNTFQGYREIEKRISLSTLFIALIDRYWESATWKGFEYTYASGCVGMTGNKRGKVVPMKIVYLCQGIDFPKYLRGCPGSLKITKTLPEFKDILLNIV